MTHEDLPSIEEDVYLPPSKKTFAAALAVAAIWAGSAYTLYETLSGPWGMYERLRVTPEKRQKIRQHAAEDAAPDASRGL